MKHDKTLSAAAAANKEAMPDDEVLEPSWPDPITTAWKDAALSGEHTPEWDALLQRPMTLLLPKDKRRNAKQTQWKNATATTGAWLYGDGGLTSCPVKNKKGYYPFVPGAGAGGSDFAARTKNGMVTLEFLALDVDSGDNLNDIGDKIEARGIAALIYASYNDQTTTSDIPRDRVLTFIKAERDPTDEEVRAYLRQQGKHREHHIESVKIVDQSTHTPGGVMIRLEHVELEKFRILFPLAEPIRITDLAPTQRKAHDRWKRLLLGYADHLGLLVDHSCVDVSRAYYVPSRRPKVEPCIDVIRGRPLTLAEIEEHERPEQKQEAKDGPGSWLKGWAKGHANRSRMADLIRENAPEMVVREVDSEKIEVVCPNKHLHSDEGDGSAWVTNADGDGRGFEWGCHRNGCKTNGMDRLDHLARAIEDGWFDEDLIEDEAYLWPDDEEEDSNVVEDAESDAVVEGEAASGDTDPQNPIPCAAWLPKGYKARGGCIYRLQKEADDIVICQTFDVVGRASDSSGTEGAGRIISFENENGVQVELTLDRAELSKTNGGETIERLSDAGMRFFGHGTAWRNEILGLLSRIDVKRRVIVATRPGFQRDRTGRVLGFLCPTGEYLDAGQGGPLTRLDSRAQVQDTDPMGTLDGWKDAADAALWRVDPDAQEKTTGNFHWTLCLAAGFGGVLLGLLGNEPVGFNLSGNSTLGKTLGLKTAASVWANPDAAKGTHFAMNTTVNAVEDLASIGSESILALDDLANMPRPQELSPMLFGLSSGAGKSRKAGRGAGLTKGAEFRPFVLLSSERGLRSTIKGAGGGDYRTGVSVRFPDVDVTGVQKVGQDVIEKIRNVERNFGHAGPAFVRHLIEKGLVQDAEEVQRRVSAAQDAIAVEGLPEGATPPPAVKRAARVFAITQVAGELAVEAGLLMEVKPIHDAIAEAFRKFRASDEGRATEGEASLLEGFKSWLVRNLDKAVIDVANDRGHSDIVGWHTPQMIVLDWNAISDVEKVGVSGTRSGLVSALGDAGAVQQSGRNNYHNKLPTEVGGGNVRNLRIDRKKLGV